MLVTDVGDETYLLQLLDVCDGFGHLCHQNFLSLNVSVGHQHPKGVTDIDITSPPPKNCHQHKVTHIDLSLTFMLPRLI